ncbi:uncharacterized protein LOC134222947 [Armigeres subalbatus]|uniref:uncharacterized protein LOC134222947 n=1 Tax=Armigeres subalbatus TaxID=124917 RepID=UPI002ED2355E
MIYDELHPRNFDVVALQVICWTGQKVWKSGYLLPKLWHHQRAGNRLHIAGIINVHCPHEGRPDDEKEAFYAQLEQTYDGCPLRDVKIVIDDMNAQVGREEMYRPVVGPNSLHTVSNDNGQRCINFAASLGMVVRSTIFPRKNIHKATWRSLNQETENLIDGKFFSDITNVRTYRSANIESDVNNTC